MSEISQADKPGVVSVKYPNGSRVITPDGKMNKVEYCLQHCEHDNFKLGHCENYYEIKGKSYHESELIGERLGIDRIMEVFG